MTPTWNHISEGDLAGLVKQGDQNAFNTLLSRHQPIIRYFDKKYYAPGLARADLHQAGCIGLFVACKRYAPYKGLAFSSFAKIHIKNHIINAVKTGLRKKQQVLNRSISLDEATASFRENLSRYETIPDVTRSPEEIYMAGTKDKEITELLKKHLTELERAAVLGLMDGLAYKEIADLTGVANKSIDNALKRAKGKLKAVLSVNA